MRTMVSIIGAVPYGTSYGTSKYLVEIIQPSLNKIKHRVINSYAIIQEAKTWEIYQDGVQLSWRSKLISLSTSWQSNKRFNKQFKQPQRTSQRAHKININPLQPGITFLYLLKTPEDLFLIFSGGIEKQHRAVIG